MPSPSSIYDTRSYDRDPPLYDPDPDPADRNREVPPTAIRDDDLSDHGSSAEALDREVLLEEEEREKLLSRSKGLFGSLGRKSGRGVKIGKRVKGARRTGGARELAGMFGGKRLGMEEGGEYGLAESGSEDESDGEDEFAEEEGLLDEKLDVDRKPRKPSWRKILVFSSLLITFLLALIFVSVSLSRQHWDTWSGTTFSNGSHVFPPTTLIISLDGVRADFLSRHLTPTLSSFINSGVSPKYMTPQFPSVTFVNHWSIATGMHAEAHGIVGNSFWDPELEKEFYYTDPSRSLQHHWWGGEPFWMTAERAGLHAAVHMWPGSEAPGWGATIVDPFNGTEALPRKVSRILEFLDMPQEKRPHLIAAYVPDVDHAGHLYGPNTTQVDNTVRAVDDMLHSLFTGFEERNLTEITNIVVVSDHGMASTSKERLLYIDKMIDMRDIEHTDGWPLYGLRPYADVNVTKIYERLKEQYNALAPEDRHWEVYLRDLDMPERYHFRDNERIAPLWIVPETGWAIVTSKEFDAEKDDVYHPRGIHGYDNENPLMRAIFVARGPAFRHLHGEGREYIGLDRVSGEASGDVNVTKGTVQSGRVKPFSNIEVYRMICESLGIAESPNNATIASLKKVELIPLEKDEDAEKAQDQSNVQEHQDLSNTTLPVESGKQDTNSSDEALVIVEPEDFIEWLKWKTEMMKSRLEEWWDGMRSSEGGN